MKNQWIMFDVETDGPSPGNYSMLSIGLINCKYPEYSFYHTFRPISNLYSLEALRVNGFDREDTLLFDKPEIGIWRLHQWLLQFKFKPEFEGKLKAISDNPGFDWGFLNYYMHEFTDGNPLGYSCNDLEMLYRGAVLDLTADIEDFHFELNEFHTHNALDDAGVNYKKFQYLIEEYELVV